MSVWREKCKLIVFSGVLSVVDSFFMMIYFDLLLFLFGLLLFCWVCCFPVRKKEQAMCKYIRYVWVCVGVWGYVWVCEEGIGNYKFASRCGDGGIISYQSAVVGVVGLYLCWMMGWFFLSYWREKWIWIGFYGVWGSWVLESNRRIGNSKNVLHLFHKCPEYVL